MYYLFFTTSTFDYDLRKTLSKSKPCLKSIQSLRLLIKTTVLKKHFKDRVKVVHISDNPLANLALDCKSKGYFPYHIKMYDFLKHFMFHYISFEKSEDLSYFIMNEDILKDSGMYDYIKLIRYAEIDSIGPIINDYKAAMNILEKEREYYSEVNRVKYNLDQLGKKLDVKYPGVEDLKTDLPKHQDSVDQALDISNKKMKEIYNTFKMAVVGYVTNWHAVDIGSSLIYKNEEKYPFDIFFEENKK